MLNFVKYQGTGNDFVLFNLFKHPQFETLTTAQIIQICDRKFGIGADGLILIKPHQDFDFEMVYYNSDGSSGIFCGNGARCIVAYAVRLGIIENKATFLAADGAHQAIINEQNWVELQMVNVDRVTRVLKGCFLNTGTDHYVQFTEKLEEIDIIEQGRALRYDEALQPGGANVNFVSGTPPLLHMRTYERGVEDETLACGTGAVAAAVIAVQKSSKTGTSNIAVKVKGGDLSVRLHYDGQAFTNVRLCGPAEFVFEGVYRL